MVGHLAATMAIEDSENTAAGVTTKVVDNNVGVIHGLSKLLISVFLIRTFLHA